MGSNNWSCGVLLLVFVVVVCEGSSSDQVVGLGFVETRGTEFVIEGTTFLFNGFNSYWMMDVAAQPNQSYKISNVFRETTAAGLTVCRTWAFSDGSGELHLQTSPGVYNEHVFQALDFVISEARRYRVRLILRRPQYVKWAKSAGVPIKSDDDFYTNAVLKTYYKNHVKKMLTRINTITGIAYKDDATIMAWELMNEPRCQVDNSGNTINGWVEEMANYVKSIDNKHLVEVGMEGFYGDSMASRKQYNPNGYQVGTDFITNNLVKAIDFATIHAYPDVWLSGQDDNSQMTFLVRWLEIHWTDSRSILKRPLIFSEFGKSKKDPGYSESGRNKFLNIVYEKIYNLARIGGISGGLVWQIMGQGMESYYDGYEIVLPQNPSTANIVSQQSKKMTALQHNLTDPHA
ncbi:hypothetical protein UlMin_021361 [Ulmus minor]